MRRYFDSVYAIPARASGAEGLGALPQWRLDDLYEAMDSPRFAADLERAARDATAFAKRWRGQLAEIAAGAGAGATLAEAVTGYEALQDLVGRVMSYASLLYASNTSDAARAKFYGDAQEKVTALAGDLLFFELELNRLDDSALDAAMATPALDHYRPWLEDIRKEKPHQLDDEIEQLFLEKSVSGAAAWNRLFDETMSALRFDFEGESLTLEPLLAKLQDPDEKKREAAANALAATLGANQRLFTLITNTLAKDKEISDRWRKFADLGRFAPSRQPGRARGGRGAGRCGHRRLSAPVASLLRAQSPLVRQGDAGALGPQRAAAWPDAPRLFLGERARHGAVGLFGLLAAHGRHRAPVLRRGLDRCAGEAWQGARRLRPSDDAVGPPLRAGQLSGKPRDVTTLAHELGHGVHQVLAAPNGALMAPTPLTLAETASVFGEMLTFRSMLATEADPGERKAMLAGKVEDMLNTVVRQIAFYKFERLIHLERRKGELAAETINQFWMQVQGESLGPAIELAAGYETFWGYIGHFIHSPFYVYAYAFGDCLVNSLYGVYENAREGFAERYLALLAAGGSKSYNELLQPFGLNARDPAFWSIGLSVIERMIAELETMG